VHFHALCFIVVQGFGHRVDSGDVDAAWDHCAVVVDGEVRVGGQEHFYLEPQGTIVLPGENDEMNVISSTQVRGMLLPST
jgi:xanthine dehydrogenase/oxidase